MRITDINRDYKQRTEDEMHKALQSLLDRKYTLHIPPDDEDPDIVLGDAIMELREARQTIEKLKQSDVEVLRLFISSDRSVALE